MQLNDNKNCFDSLLFGKPANIQALVFKDDSFSYGWFISNLKFWRVKICISFLFLLSQNYILYLSLLHQLLSLSLSQCLLLCNFFVLAWFVLTQQRRYVCKLTTQYSSLPIEFYASRQKYSLYNYSQRFSYVNFTCTENLVVGIDFLILLFKVKYALLHRILEVQTCILCEKSCDLKSQGLKKFLN